MKSLLTPVINNCFSMYQFPHESSILQVLNEVYVMDTGIDGEGPFMQLILSDGNYSFCGFIAQGTLPGKNSLIRISPSDKNKVINLWADGINEFRDFMYVEKLVKILDGEYTNGTIGNPIEILDIA